MESQAQQGREGAEQSVGDRRREDPKDEGGVRARAVEVGCRRQIRAGRERW